MVGQRQVNVDHPIHQIKFYIQQPEQQQRFVSIQKKDPLFLDNDSGRWFRPPDLAGSCRKAPEIIGKKFEKFPAGILLPQNHRNYSEPAVSGPDCSTWGTHVLQYIFKTIVNYSEKDRFIFFPYAVRDTTCVT